MRPSSPSRRCRLVAFFAGAALVAVVAARPWSPPSWRAVAFFAGAAFAAFLAGAALVAAFVAGAAFLAGAAFVAAFFAGAALVAAFFAGAALVDPLVADGLLRRRGLRRGAAFFAGAAFVAGAPSSPAPAFVTDAVFVAALPGRPTALRAVRRPACLADGQRPLGNHVEPTSRVCGGPRRPDRCAEDTASHLPVSTAKRST